MATKLERLWIANAETARKIGKTVFKGAVLFAFDPDWCFNYPKWMGGGVGESTFRIPNYVMGLIAETRGMPWQWEKDGWLSHPDARKKVYEECIAREAQARKEMQELIRQYKRQSGKPTIHMKSVVETHPGKTLCGITANEENTVENPEGTNSVTCKRCMVILNEPDNRDEDAIDNEDAEVSN